MRRSETTLVFSRQDACLEGHFPGDPVVPAVAILAELAGRIESETGARVVGIKSARFRAALAPGVSWTIEMQEHNDGTLAITCRNKDHVAMSARFRVERS